MDRINNLIAVYNENPVLQSKFSLDEYLNIMEPGSYTPPTIAEAITEQPVESIVNTQQSITNQGGDRDTFTPIDPNAVKYPYGGGSSENFNLGPKGEAFDYEADAYNIGPTFAGQLSKIAIGLGNLPTPFNYLRTAISNSAQIQKEKEEAAIKKAEEERVAKELIAEAEKIEAARIEAAQKAAFDKAMADQKSFYDSLNDGRGATSTQESRDNAGGGEAANRGDEGSGWDSSPFARGGRVKSYFNGGIVSLRRR